MSAPKTKTNASGSKRKIPVGNGSNEPVTAGEKKDTSKETVFLLAGGKPDKVAYEKEQDRIQREVYSLQTKLVSSFHGPLNSNHIPSSSPSVRLPFGRKLTQPANQMRTMNAGMHLRLSSTISERSNHRGSTTRVDCWSRSSLFRITFRTRYIHIIFSWKLTLYIPFWSRLKHCKPRNQKSPSNLFTKWITMLRM